RDPHGRHRGDPVGGAGLVTGAPARRRPRRRGAGAAGAQTEEAMKPPSCRPQSPIPPPDWGQVDSEARNLQALAALRHLLDHVHEDREPVRFVAGRGAWDVPEIHWAAAVLGYDLACCVDPSCTEPNHITIETRPCREERA